MSGRIEQPHVPDRPRGPDLPELSPPTAELIERARAFRDAGLPPAPAKPSATVILLRDRADQDVRPDGSPALEVFMLRRRAAMSFAGGMHVFPGGVVDPADRSGRTLEDALTAAAIRETFEETGLLLATGPFDDPVALESDRLALIAHRATFDEVCARHRLVPQPNWLRAWSHWTTPDFEPRRYDTRFFVAQAVGGQSARDMGGESDAAAWVTPASALAASARGEWLLMPPTETTLRELAVHGSAAAAFEAARHRETDPLYLRIDLDVEPPVFARRLPP